MLVHNAAPLNGGDLVKKHFSLIKSTSTLACYLAPFHIATASKLCIIARCWYSSALSPFQKKSFICFHLEPLIDKHLFYCSNSYSYSQPVENLRARNRRFPKLGHHALSWTSYFDHDQLRPASRLCRNGFYIIFSVVYLQAPQ